jgi:hypothetical protein
MVTLGTMIHLPFFYRQKQAPTRPPTEREVLNAGEEFERKEQLVDRFRFLPPETNRAAKDTALQRFLEILFHHLRS